MSNFKLVLYSKLVLLITVFVVFCLSCKKENTVSPDQQYVGIWVGDYSDLFLGSNYKETRTLTNSTFVDLTQLYDSSSAKWIDYIKMAGTISIKNDTMIFKLTEYGITSYDNVTSKPTGEITSYRKGTSGFETLCTSMLQPSTFYFLFSISGNKMLSKLDLNEDGDFNDDNESLELTKQ